MFKKPSKEVRVFLLHTLLALVLLCLAIGTLWVVISARMAGYTLPSYGDTCFVSIGCIYLILSAMYWLIAFQRGKAFFSRGEELVQSEEQRDAYRRQMQHFCKVLEARATLLLNDGNQHRDTSIRESKAALWYVIIYAIVAALIAGAPIFILVRGIGGQADINLFVFTGIALVFLMIVLFIVRALAYRQMFKKP